MLLPRGIELYDFVGDRRRRRIMKVPQELIHEDDLSNDGFEIASALIIRNPKHLGVDIANFDQVCMLVRLWMFSSMLR